MFGAIEVALEKLTNLKHLAIIACDYRRWDDVPIPEEDSDDDASFMRRFYGPPHYAEVRLLLPLLQVCFVLY